jgi:hypothetical protein
MLPDVTTPLISDHLYLQSDSPSQGKTPAAPSPVQP